jgi:site-specific recombinase XerD
LIYNVSGCWPVHPGQCPLVYRCSSSGSIAPLFPARTLYSPGRFRLPDQQVTNGGKETDMLLNDALEDRLSALKRQGRSPRTIDWYRFFITALDRSLLIHDLDQVSLRDLRAFVDGLIANGCKDATIHGAQIALKSFFKWSTAEGLIAVNPAERLEVRQVPRREPEALDTSAVIALLNAAAGTLHAERNKALIAFMTETGFRLKEVTDLLVKDLDIESMVVYTSQSLDGRNSAKGNKPRFVPFGAASQKLLREWLAVRPAHLTTVFGLTGWGIRDMLDDLGQTVGIKVTPHKFRRTSATLRAEGSIDANTLKSIMGWETISISQHYIDKARLMQQARATSPMNRVMRSTD